MSKKPDALVELVKKATAPENSEPNDDLNASVFDYLLFNKNGAKEAAKAMRKRLESKEPQVVYLTFALVDVCIESCFDTDDDNADKFLQQLASKSFVAALVDSLSKKTMSSSQAKRIASYIQKWGLLFGKDHPKYSVFYETYRSLQKKGVDFPVERTDDQSETGSTTTDTLDDDFSNLHVEDDPDERLRADLLIIQENVDILAEMLEAVDPKEEDVSNNDIVQELVFNCQAMQPHLMVLIQEVQTDSLRKDLHDLYQKLEDTLVRYETLKDQTKAYVESLKTQADKKQAQLIKMADKTGDEELSALKDEMFDILDQENSVLREELRRLQALLVLKEEGAHHLAPDARATPDLSKDEIVRRERQAREEAEQLKRKLEEKESSLQQQMRAKGGSIIAREKDLQKELEKYKKMLQQQESKAEAEKRELLSRLESEEGKLSKEGAKLDEKIAKKNKQADIDKKAEVDERLQNAHAEIERLRNEMRAKEDEQNMQVEELLAERERKAKEEMEDILREKESEYNRQIGRMMEDMKKKEAEFNEQMAKVLKKGQEASASEVEKLRKLMEDKERQSREEMERIQHKLKEKEAWADAEVARTQEKIEAERKRIENERESERKEREAKQREEIERVKQQIAAAEAQKTKELESKLDEKEREARDALTKYLSEMKLRKKLHNEIQTMKGNIRVYCRVRPIKSTEGESCMKVYPQDEDEDEGTIGVLSGDGKEKKYAFERVFGSKSTQSEIFRHTKGLVQSALDGYPVCIFAYGQTGSGKTHTMEGPPEDPGVNFRALEALFETVAEEEERGTSKHTIEVAMFEIYNEKIRDLLRDPGSAEKNLEIRMGSKGPFVPDARLEAVATMDDVRRVYDNGKKTRSTHATNMNEHSSRSHMILSVYTTGENLATGEKTYGKLHLIDLAGSERVGLSGAEGERLEEAKNINKSLLCLGEVIASLSSGTKHVPYRNSKLTHLLQDSLGGSAKTLMFLAIAPAGEYMGESLCSLNFGKRARTVELGKAKKNKDESDLTKYKTMINKMDSAMTKAKTKK